MGSPRCGSPHGPEIRCPEKTFIDANRLLPEELLANLLDNAAHGGSRGHITPGVRARPVPQIYVEDNGVGIPMDQRQSFFKRFHRLASSPGNGSGLGLAILQEIARGHTAEVRLKDTELVRVCGCWRFFRPPLVGSIHPQVRTRAQDSSGT